MTTGARKAGDFCWINLMTPEPDKARKFFGALLDWTTPEMPGMGYRIQVGGRDVGGLFDVVSPRTPKGMPPVIGVMIKVDDADAIANKAKSLGGEAKDAFDIGDAGRMAVCVDPNGAEFDVWEPKKMTGTDVDTNLHGAPTWFETITTDPDRTAQFYTSLFGWTAETQPISGSTYTHFKLDGVPIAGMLKATPEMEIMRPHWGTYFAVDNADDAARKAAELGGTVCVPATPIPPVGRFCGLVSPQGVVFYAIEYAR